MSEENKENSKPAVTIIIPTTCEKCREKQLYRAVESVVSQKKIPVELIVVANGPLVDDNIFQTLKSFDNLKLLFESKGSQQLAQQIGRRSVVSDYFGILDDDDELLPDSIEKRINMLEDDKDIVAAVINGKVVSDGNEQRYFYYDDVIEKPLESLLHKNWLASCGALFRTSVVDESYFTQPYYEYTYIAFRLALKYKIGFIDEDGFVVHKNSPGSLSKSDAYRDVYFDFLLMLLDIPSSSQIQALLKAKLGNAYHCRAEEMLNSNKYFEAWKYHIKSIRMKGGMKYLFYTRKFIEQLFSR